MDEEDLPSFEIEDETSEPCEIPEMTGNTMLCYGIGTDLGDSKDEMDAWIGAIPYHMEVQGPKGTARINGYMEEMIRKNLSFIMEDGYYRDDHDANILEDVEALRRAVAERIKILYTAFRWPKEGGL